jgi:hypothetical protein
MTNPDDLTPDERARLLTELINDPRRAPRESFTLLLSGGDTRWLDGSMALTADEVDDAVSDVAPADQFAGLLTGVSHLDGRRVDESTIGQHLAHYVDTIPVDVDGGDDTDVME